jgi:hypothetical protein
MDFVPAASFIDKTATSSEVWNGGLHLSLKSQRLNEKMTARARRCKGMTQLQQSMNCGFALCQRVGLGGTWGGLNMVTSSVTICLTLEARKNFAQSVHGHNYWPSRSKKHINGGVREWR